MATETFLGAAGQLRGLGSFLPVQSASKYKYNGKLVKLLRVGAPDSSSCGTAHGSFSAKFSTGAYPGHSSQANVSLVDLSAGDATPSSTGRVDSELIPLVRRSLLSVASASAVLAVTTLAAHAGETAPEGFFELILHTVESLGPLGPAAFILAVSVCECIPLFPTQPLSLASGLLFGAQKGALCMLTGTTLAAFLAFVIARGIGRPLAERIIRHEMAEGGDGAAKDGSRGGLVQAKLREVQTVIEQGAFWQQAGAVFVLRMTPIVPFSASNYVLGLSPLPLPPYLLGTVAGMAFWSCIYASFGGASRALLRRGADPDMLLGELMHKVGSLTEEAGAAAAVAGGVAAVAWGISLLKKRVEVGDSGDSSESSGISATVPPPLHPQRELAGKE